MLQALRNQINFARQVSLGKILRRAALTAKRNAMLVIGRREDAPVLATKTPALAHELPKPMFPPRQNASWAPERGLQVTFLGRTDQFSMPMDWKLPTLTNQNHLWAMNLHYMEFLESLPDDVVVNLMASWIVSNPRYRPGYWKDSWNSYALSIRVVVWMQAIAARDLCRDDRIRQLVIPSLVAQLRFLERNLETDIDGNHLVKNVKALAWSSAFFSGAEAERFAELALALLPKVSAQILPDGFHYERSPSYHAQVFADLLEIRQTLDTSKAWPDFDDALASMASALSVMTHPDGGPALFNDAGLTMAYAPSECLAAFELVTGRSPAGPSSGAFSLPHAGYYGFRSDGTYCVIDCGEMAPRDLPAHGHGDLLSFELSWNGLRFIVDQGVFEYSPGPKRDWSRSSHSHNTLSVEGCDQAEFFGSFRIGARAVPLSAAPRLTEDKLEFVGSHAGFFGLGHRAIHVREFSVGKCGVFITDRVEGAATLPEARVTFLLHPEVDVTARGKQVTLRREGTVLLLNSDCDMSAEPAVWWPDMGEEVATTRLVAHLGTTTTAATFLISPFSGH